MKSTSYLKTPRLSPARWSSNLTIQHWVIIKQVGIPFKMSDTKPEIRSMAPLTGQNTAEILAELGYSKADIKKMKDNGFVKPPVSLQL